MSKRKRDQEFDREDIGFVGVRMLMRQSIRPPKKSEQEWARMGDDILMRLDASKSRSPQFLNWATWVSMCWSPRAAAVVGCVAFAITAAFFLSAPTHEEVRTVRLVRTQGEISFLSRIQPTRDKGALESIAPTQVLTPGTIIETSQGSTVLHVDSGTGIEIGENSRVELLKSSSRGFVLSVEKGTILAIVSKRRQDQEFRILTPNGVCQVVGTRFVVEVNPLAISTNLQVIEGEVAFSHRTNRRVRTSVTQGRSATLLGLALMENGGSALPDIARHESTLEGILELQSKDSLGVVEITSTPLGAEVIIEGMRLGRTPLVLNVPVGNPQVILMHLGRIQLDTVLKVKAHKVTRLTAQSLPAHATLDSATTPHERPRSSRLRRKYPAVQEHASASAPQQPPPPAAGTPRLQEIDSIEQLISKADYAGALYLLADLEIREDLQHRDRLKVLELRAACARKTADHWLLISTLERLYHLEENRLRRENLLWEVITLKSTHVRDPESTEMDIIEYLISFPNGIYGYDAHSRLAEIQYLLGKYEAAARTYEKLIRNYPSGPNVDRSFYALAQIWSQNLDNCQEGLRWYNRVLRDYPNSSMRENALFWKAECLARSGRIKEARAGFADYVSEYPNGLWKRAVSERLGAAHKD